MNLSELAMASIPVVIGLLIIGGALYHDFAVWMGWRAKQ